MEPNISLDIDQREPITCRDFPPTGTYEKVLGTIHLAIDPGLPGNQVITDIEYAPENSEGLVEFSTDFYMLKPVDLRDGNQRILYDVNNRGNKRILRFFNDAVETNTPNDPEHFGNGFLLRRGYTILWTGWQGNISTGDHRMTIEVPVAQPDDGAITGKTRMEYIANEPGTHTIPLSGNQYTDSYPVASREKTDSSFTKREYETDDRQPIPNDEWEFATTTDTGERIASHTDCYYESGFTPGWIYELVYTTRDPPVMGLGFAGVRDVISFLLFNEETNDNSHNPLAGDGSPDAAYAWGRSQSGRFLREFVYQGFNRDHHDRQIFAAISPHVAGAGRVALNYRFAQPGRYPRQHEEHLYPSDQFPFTYAETTDPYTNRTDGILKRPETDPLVIHTQTASEYWQRRGSLVHTDPDGNDLADQPGVRWYLFASTQHAAGPDTEPGTGPHRYPSNPLGVTPLLRALLDALHEWASNSEAPPPSRVPTRREGTAVTAEQALKTFPPIPDVDLPTGVNHLYRQEFGPEFDDGIISNQPPTEIASEQYPVFVPAVNDIGNERPGVRVPQLTVPTATYTGWNLREHGPAENAMASITGGYFPLPESTANTDDPTESRPAVTELYSSKEEYEVQIVSAAEQLVEEGFMLEEDKERIATQAEQLDFTE